MSNPDDFGRRFVKAKKVESAIIDLMQAINRHDLTLSDTLNNLLSVTIKDGENVKQVGCIDALTISLDTSRSLMERFNELEIAAQNIVNAISQYDDIHDYHNPRYDEEEDPDPIINELEGNLNKLLTINGEESGKIVSRGCVDNLKNILGM